MTGSASRPMGAMTHHRLRRLAALGVLAAVVTLASAAPAGAHGSSAQQLPDAAHYLTTLTSVSPVTAGITARVDPRGEWIEVTNTTAQNLTVLGYFREPYLVAGPQGVAQNDFSASLQLNQSLFADLSQTTAATLPPSWRPISTGHTARWHDHRIHWMTADRPPNVKAHPGRRQQIGAWQIHLQLGTTPINVTGTLTWLPINSSPLTAKQVLILVLDSAALLVGAAGIGLYVMSQRRRSRRAPRVGPGPEDIASTRSDTVAARQAT